MISTKKTSLLITAILGGCTVGPDYHKPRMNVPASFSAATTQPTATAQITTLPSAPAPGVDVTRWWESLNDAELNSLVDRAIAANPDLHIALNRLQEAREVVAVVNGQDLPTAEFSAGLGRGGKQHELGAQGASRRSPARRNQYRRISRDHPGRRVRRRVGDRSLRTNAPRRASRGCDGAGGSRCAGSGPRHASTAMSYALTPMFAHFNSASRSISRRLR